MEITEHLKVNKGVLKIIGLLGDYPKKLRKSFQQSLCEHGYQEDVTTDNLKIVLKDIFYREFREILFEGNSKKKKEDWLGSRYFSAHADTVTFNKRDFRTKNITDTYEATVVKSEVFFFRDEIALFSLSINVNEANQHLQFYSDLINQVRNFDAELGSDLNAEKKGMPWHQWISEKYLAGTELRSAEKNIKADEYSGSKFKVFSVFDCQLPAEQRDSYLFDLATSSPLKSGMGIGNFAPHTDYYQTILKNKVSYFKNWESLCLFDSFTTLGQGLLFSESQQKTWEDTYFRIYLFRLFFKYNLFRYNSELHENTVKLRNQFEKFLNDYHINHISFNFLPNEIYKKIGASLHLDEEMATFQHRINRISDDIQEEKQSRMNMLLQVVAGLSAVGSVQPIFDGLSMAQKFLGWSNPVFYSILTVVLLVLLIGVSYFLFPDVIKKMLTSKKKQQP